MWETKYFYQFFAPFLKAASNFKHSGNKGDSNGLFISEITDCEIRD